MPGKHNHFSPSSTPVSFIILLRLWLVAMLLKPVQPKTYGSYDVYRLAKDDGIDYYLTPGDSYFCQLQQEDDRSEDLRQTLTYSLFYPNETNSFNYTLRNTGGLIMFDASTYMSHTRLIYEDSTKAPDVLSNYLLLACQSYNPDRDRSDLDHDCSVVAANETAVIHPGDCIKMQLSNEKALNVSCPVVGKGDFFASAHSFGEDLSKDADILDKRLAPAATYADRSHPFATYSKAVHGTLSNLGNSSILKEACQPV